jgi:pyrrolysine biosynthesis protein PylD
VTRLKSLDIESISAQLDNYDAELRIKTGCTLLGLACHAVETEKNIIQDLIVSFKVGVVPTTCGKGIISGFADAIKSIASHMGFKAFTTRHTDISGIAEAIENKADILMMADDNRFVALHLKHHRLIDNSSATGKGYAAGLDLMNKGVKGEKCLVIGCGPVGRSAASALINFGAIVSVYDINQQRCRDLAEELNRSFDRNIKIERTLESALKNYRLLIEATDAANVISDKNITPETYIAAPGMPLGLNAAAYEKVYDRLLHDPLQIGSATMLVSAVIKDLR